MNKSEEQSESINCTVRVCIAFNMVMRIKYFLALLSKEWRIKGCSVQPEMGYCSLPPQCWHWTTIHTALANQFCKDEASSCQGPEVINKGAYKPVQVYEHVHTQMAN